MTFNKFFPYNKFNVNKKKILFIIYLIFKFNYSMADWQHHNSFLIGERAAGMGGAYTAISNDPSGIYYNPGGVAFTKNTEISLSTVGYFIEDIKVNSIYGFSDYQYEIKNSDIITGFFGFTNKFTLFDEEFFWGVAVYVPDHTNIITNLNFNSPSYINNISIKRYIVNSRETGNESNYQVSLSKLIREDLGAGIAVGVFNIQHDEINTNNILGGIVNNSNFYFEADNIDVSSYYIRGINLNLGILYKLTEYLSIGFAANFKFPIFQNYSRQALESLYALNPDGTPYTGTITSNTLYSDRLSSDTNNTVAKIMPYRFSLGIAYNVTKNILVSFDSSYFTGMHSAVDKLSLKPIFNYSLGSEFKILDQFSIRLGLFTNNYAGSSFASEQIINADFIGLSTGLAYTNENKTTYSLTSVYQRTSSAQYYNTNLAAQGRYPSVSWYSVAILAGVSSSL
ncbi:OmpP1/FadL family transporter [Pigmentibacter ruber]